MSAKIATIGVAAVLALAAPLVMRWEGVRYTPYRDAVNVLTVCFGHTGPDIVPGKRYTRSECDELLDDDMRAANMMVRICISRDMPLHVEAALTSAAFNIGRKVVCGSTLQRKANAGDWAAACKELDKWRYAGGRVYRGLVLRRADERKLCEGKA